MSSDNYKILYSSKDQFLLMVTNKFQNWNDQLDRIESRMNAIVSLDSFEGEAADSIKTYITEVYSLLLISVRQTLVDYQARLMQYSNGYYGIDSNIYAVLSRAALEEVQGAVPTEKSYLAAQDTVIWNALNDVQDIISLSSPSQEDIEAAMNAFSEHVRQLDEQIVTHESTNRSVADGELANLISSLSATINSFVQTRGGMTTYQSGDYVKRPEVLTLYKNVTDSMNYIEQNQGAIQEAALNLQEVYIQQQKDLEEQMRKEQAEARKDEGMANMIVGGLAVVGGVAAIVLTAGAATPVVVVAAASGTCAAAYGVSNIAEGAQDYYYGSIGDIDSFAWNPIRDTVFQGNQSAYDAWGNISLTVAGLCVPVGKAVNSVAGASGTVIAKKVVTTVGKEVVQDAIVGKISDSVTNYVAEEYDLNKTETVILKTVTEKVLDSAADKVVDKAVDVYTESRGGKPAGDFAEGMSYEDAKRYNQFMDDPESTRKGFDLDSADQPNSDAGLDGVQSDTRGGSLADGMSADDAERYNRFMDDPESTRKDFELDSADQTDSNAAADMMQDDSGMDYQMNTEEEKAIIREMEEKGEFIEEIQKRNGDKIEVNHGAVEVEKADGPADPRSHLPTGKKGTIIGDRDSGTFEYIPDDEKTRAIMAKYGQETVKYNDSNVEFKPFAKQETQWGTVECEVEIGHMNSSRLDSGDVDGNYSQADAALAEKISRETGHEVTKTDIEAYREANNLTWHEVEDAKTMQLIPTEINKNCPHRGGTSEAKYRQSWGDVSKDFT